MSWPSIAMLVALAACGRLRFDARGDAAAADVDAEILDPAHCPSGYQFLGLDAGLGTKSCYRYAGTTNATWLDAEHACEADGPGAHLVVIDDANEAAIVDTLQPSLDAWVGTSDRVTEGVYLSVTGGAAPFLTWAPGSPVGGTGANCVQYTDSRTFEDLACGPNTNEYTCEYDAMRAQPAAY